jgi:hypothetical protein
MKGSQQPTIGLSVRVSPAEAAFLSGAAVSLRCPQAEVVRRAIRVLWVQMDAPGALVPDQPRKET